MLNKCSFVVTGVVKSPAQQVTLQGKQYYEVKAMTSWGKSFQIFSGLLDPQVGTAFNSVFKEGIEVVMGSGYIRANEWTNKTSGTKYVFLSLGNLRLFNAPNTGFSKPVTFGQGQYQGQAAAPVQQTQAASQAQVVAQAPQQQVVHQAVAPQQASQQSNDDIPYDFM